MANRKVYRVYQGVGSEEDGVELDIMGEYNTLNEAKKLYNNIKSDESKLDLYPNYTLYTEISLVTLDDNNDDYEQELVEDYEFPNDEKGE